MRRILATLAMMTALAACKSESSSPPAPSKPPKPTDQDGPSPGNGGPGDGTPRRRSSTFYIQDGQLYDKSGHAFIARGVNNPHAYYKDQAYLALERIAQLGLNAVRIVWCPPTLVRAGRCEAKDMHDLSELRRVLTKLRALNLVGILVAQNATGSDQASDLEAVADWYVQADVVGLLNEFQDMLLINIANEWMSRSGNPQNTYTPTYSHVIGRLRSAGLNHVLIVDAPGWGQDADGLLAAADSLRAVDPNLLFSVHMYESFAEDKKVYDVFDRARQAQLPLIIGEFACSHGAGRNVACEAIMSAANQKANRVGYLAWSYSGNGDSETDLNVTSYTDWKTLTNWGAKLIQSANGIKATAQTACMFASGDVCGP